MPQKNKSLTITYQAWNTSTQTGQANDTANHTIRLIQDGVLTSVAPANAPSEPNPTTFPGTCTLTLTAAEMNHDSVAVVVASSTANVVIRPVLILNEPDMTSTVVPANVTEWLGSAPPTPATPGVPVVDTRYWDGASTVDGMVVSATSTTITLPNSFQSTDDYYNWQTISIPGGAGIGQSRLIVDYVGSTRTATVDTAWATGAIPDTTSSFVLGSTSRSVLELTQSIPLTNTAQTIGDALNAALAQGFGKWEYDPTAKTLTVYAPDKTTVLYTFTIGVDGNGNAVSRT